MSETGYVYTLDDPRTGEPRYVGATVNPSERLTLHTTAPHSDALAEWVKELDECDTEPEMTLIRVANVEALRDVEAQLVENLRDEFELLNADSHVPYTRRCSITSDEAYEPSDREEQILALLKAGREADQPWGRVTVKYVSEELGIRRQYVNRDLGSLVSAGWVVKPVKGLYEFVEDPRDQ